VEVLLMSLRPQAILFIYKRTVFGETILLLRFVGEERDLRRWS